MDKVSRYGQAKDKVVKAKVKAQEYREKAKDRAKAGLSPKRAARKRDEGGESPELERRRKVSHEIKVRPNPNYEPHYKPSHTPNPSPQP